MKHRIIIMFSALFFAFALFPVYSASAKTLTFPDFTEEQLSSPATISSILQSLGIPHVITIGKWNYNGYEGDKMWLYYSLESDAKFTIVDNIISLDKKPTTQYITNVIKKGKYEMSGLTTNSNFNFTLSPTLYSAMGKLSVGAQGEQKGLYYYNPNGSVMNELGENLAIPPVPINEQDMLDIPVGTIRLMYPINTAHLTVGDEGAELEIMIDGKAGYLKVLPSGFPDIGQAFHSKYLNDAMTKDYSISVNGKTVKSTVDVFNIFGKKKDWAENNFVTFEGLYKISMKELKSGPCTITFGCNVLIPKEEDLYYMEWRSVSVQLNVEFQKDLNGDGYDDDTGKKLVNGAVLDNDGDGAADGHYTRPTDENGSDFFSGFVNSIKNVPQYTSEIGRAFSSIFNMFPSPIPQLAVTGIIIMIFVAVISFIRGA